MGAGPRERLLAVVRAGGDFGEMEAAVAGAQDALAVVEELYDVVGPAERQLSGEQGFGAYLGGLLDDQVVGAQGLHDRWVHAQHHERFLVAAVLDGHHRLAAYAATGGPARVLMISRLEEHWTEDGPWGAVLDESLEPLRVR